MMGIMGKNTGNDGISATLLRAREDVFGCLRLSGEAATTMPTVAYRKLTAAELQRGGVGG